MSFEKTFEAPIKIRMALGCVPGLPKAAGAAFDTWLVEAGISAQADNARARFALAADARFDAVALRASFETAALPGGLASRFEGVISDDELARLDVAIEQVEPARVACWIESRSSELERGWRVLGEVPLARALALADANPKVAALAAFGEAHGIEIVRRLGRSAGEGGNRFTEAAARLPGSGEEALEVGLEAFRALKAPRLPGQLIEAMRMAVRGPLLLSVWLTEQAVSHVGIVLAHPTTVETLRLCHAIGADHMEPLAAIEGALGVEGASEVECAVGAGGPTVHMEYDF